MSKLAARNGLSGGKKNLAEYNNLGFHLPMAQQDFPFIYFGEGCSYFEKNFECCIWFRHQLSEEDRKIIIENHPFPPEIFKVYVASSQAVFFDGDENYEFAIKEMFDPEFKKFLLLDKEGKAPIDIWGNEKNFMPSAGEWIQFDKAITAWLLEVHQKFPIAFAFKPAKIFKKAEHNQYGEYSPWHEWSLAHMGEIILPELRKFYQQNQPDQKMAERLNWLSVAVLEEILKLYKGKNKKNIEEKRKFIEFAEMVCEHDGIFELDPYGRNQEIIFRNGSMVEHLLKDFADDQKKEMVEKLSPYTQLTLISVNDRYPFLLLFDQPLSYLSALVEKVVPQKKRLLSSFVCSTMVHLQNYWRDKNPEGEKKDLLLGLADAVLNLPDFQIHNYMRVEAVFLKYGAWEKVLQLYCNPDYLLRFSDPVAQLRTIIAKIPGSEAELIRKYLQEIAENVIYGPKEPKEMGFEHNYQQIAEQILTFIH